MSMFWPHEETVAAHTWPGAPYPPHSFDFLVCTGQIEQAGSFIPSAQPPAPRPLMHFSSQLTTPATPSAL